MSDARPEPDERLFERELERELLRTERLRATLAAIFVSCALLFLIALFSLRAGDFEATLQHPAQRWGILLAPASYVALVLLMRRYLGRCIDTDAPVTPWVRYLSAAAEVSVPTAGIVIFTTITSATGSLHSPPAMLYPLMIIMWTLALNWRICLFAGALSSVQYLGVFAYYRGQMLTELPGTLLTATPPFVVRAAILLATGLLTAVLAYQLRRRLVASLRANHEHARVRQIFGQHVSPEVVDTLLDRGGADSPESRHVCVMFVDVRGFTRFAEARQPGEVVAYLDRLLEPLLRRVSDRGGIVNKLLGDGFMAVFGAPVADPDPEANAVQTARELLVIVEELVSNGELPETVIGIGLHAGPAITGSVGSGQRKEYTVIGDTVNLAARIEGLNKRFGSRLLASSSVVEAARPEGVCEPLGEVEIRGRAEPALLYRLV